MSQIPSLKIIFAGTPDFAATHLDGLLSSIDCPHEIIAVYSQPDRPAGRGKKLQPSPVKQLALDHHIAVFQPVNFKSIEAQAELAELNADLMIVVAYGLLLPQVILQAPKLGCINVHASLLPRWRGAAPIQRAVEAGDTETGVTIMQMDVGLDTGDMLQKTRCAILPEDTGGSVHDKLAILGVPALIETVNLIALGKISPAKQNDSLSCYAAKISKLDAIIDWRCSAAEIERKVRAFNPFPVAYTSLHGERIKIWQAALSDITPSDISPSDETSDDSADKPGIPPTREIAGTIIRATRKEIVVACGQGYLSLQQLQLPGGKAMEVMALMNSKAGMFSVGTQFDVL